MDSLKLMLLPTQRTASPPFKRVTRCGWRTGPRAGGHPPLPWTAWGQLGAGVPAGRTLTFPGRLGGRSELLLGSWAADAELGGQHADLQPHLARLQDSWEAQEPEPRTAGPLVSSLYLRTPLSAWLALVPLSWPWAQPGPQP